MIRRTYHPLSVTLHWLMFILFVVALSCIELRGWTTKASPWHNLLRNWHVDAGLLVLLFALVRVGARVGLGAPQTIGSPIQVKLAHALHGLLYLVMFLLPITGVAFSQMGGRSVALFGWVLPQLVGPDPVLRATVKDVHELLGNAVYFLVGAHALAALWHHFVLKDETLNHMRFK
jgi:superoxide oxidase